MRSTFRYALMLLLPLALAASAQQARAGVVYVPHPGPVEIGGELYETQIWASNTDGQQIRRIEHLFIRSLTDGTVREDPPTVVRIPPGVTTRLEIGEADSGMVEIFAAPQVVINARLMRVTPNGAGAPGGRGAQLPVVSSDNAADAGETIHLQGWERIRNAVWSNLGIINLGNGDIQCEIGVFRADGSQIASNALIQFKPRSHVQFERALGILQAGNARDVRSEVTCSQPFYAYASIFYGIDDAPDATDVVYVEPSASGSSELGRPIDEGDFIYLDAINWSETNNIRNGPHKNVSGWDPHAGHSGVGGYKKIEINGVAYDHGISWFPGWNDSWVAWRLNGDYQRFTATVRIDDEKTGEYEWGIVNRRTGEFVDLRRPAGGFRANETSNQFRIGAGAGIRIYGDGQLLFESEEFYAYGPAVQVDIDVTGVQVLRIVLEADHHELAQAPHRAGLPSTPALVRRCTWFDLIDVADAKLFPVN